MHLPICEGGLERAGEGLLTGTCSDTKKGNGFKPKEDRFILNIRKKSFPVRAVRHRHRLPSEAVDSPSLELFKARLHQAWSSLVSWKVSLPVARGLEQNYF